MVCWSTWQLVYSLIFDSNGSVITKLKWIASVLLFSMSCSVDLRVWQCRIEFHKICEWRKECLSFPCVCLQSSFWIIVKIRHKNVNCNLWNNFFAKFSNFFPRNKNTKMRKRKFVRWNAHRPKLLLSNTKLWTKPKNQKKNSF